MEVLKKIKKIVSKLDLFYSNQILRYNQENKYKTFTGGILSAIIISLILFSFSNMIIGTMQRTTIDSKFQMIRQSDPPLFNIVPGQETKFMFGIQIASLDLNYIADLVNEPKVFDVAMTVFTTIDGVVTSDLKTPLQQCTKEHWKMMPSLIQEESFEAFGVSRWLCPQIGTVLPIKGHYTSKENIQIKIEIYQCSNATSNTACATKEEIDQIFETYSNFYLTYFYINPVINPNKPDHLSYFLEGDDYTIFSRDVGCEATVFISDYTITSDNSIIPLQDTLIDRGFIMLDKSQKHLYSITNNTPLSYLYFSKSQNTLSYQREVLKISAVISYIGGLIGAVTAVLFLVKVYTDCSLQINTGIKLFCKNMQADNEQQSPKSFSLLNFIKLNVYHAFRKIGLYSQIWQDCKNFNDYQNQICKQLDIKLILKRLIMMETCITYLFDEDQLQGIRNQAQISCQKAKELREIFIKSANYARQIYRQRTQNTIKSVKDDNKISDEPKIFIKKDSQCSTANQFLHKTISLSEKQNKESIMVQDVSEMPFQQIQKIKKQIHQQKPMEIKQSLLQFVDIKSLQQLKIDAENNQTSLKIWNNLNAKIKSSIEALPTTKKHKKSVFFK